MDSNEIRRRFLDFFQARGHSILPSDSLAPARDPSLLFTGAGMNPFKEHFLGLKRDLKRAASCQKCFRTGDVEQVGQTPSHLTFFEMLGNFSFGDYFKKEACLWAWEFLTRELKIPSERLWASVYESDEEAAEIWRREIGLPSARIVRFGAKDNFWPSNAPAEGPNGPCGPCSEIYFDTQRCLIGRKCPTPDDCKPGCPCGRFVEIWNLVFTQYDRRPDGSLKDLPAKNIDTGMGLERLTAVLQDKMSVFETDLFAPIVEEIEALVRPSTILPVSRQEDSGRTEPVAVSLSNRDRTSFYAIADHARALTFLIGDGVIPSNEGRGYVLRMLLRKAERAGMGWGLPKPFLYRLVPAITAKMQEPYPELADRRETIAQAVLAEEERFHEMLAEKRPLLEELVLESAERPNVSRTVLPAEAAARFYDTHGVSLDEITDFCRRKGVGSPSKEAFDRALEKLQAKSKAAGGFSKSIFTKDEWLGLVGEIKKPTDFLGYSDLKGAGRVAAILQENRFVPEARSGAKIGVILDRTPFYGESGGQVGDAGEIEGPDGKLKVIDTQWVGFILVHQAEVVEGRLRKGDPVTAIVDTRRRRKTAQNHTATHLLHSALRKVLGTHVMQAGSLVAPDHLRFDFSHSQGVPRREMETVESLVNEWVEKNLSVEVAQMTLEEARRAGAVALFGEKYGRNVRVVSIGEVSKELCGGTHLTASGEVGRLTIVEEGSVAAGVRRVKALTDREADAFLRMEAVRLSEEKERLARRAEERERAGELQRQRVKEAQAQAKEAEKKQIGPFSFFEVRSDQSVGPVALRSSADVIRRPDPEKTIALLTDSQGFFVITSGDAAQKQGIRANELLKFVTGIAGGSGGGRPGLAQGRVEYPARLVEAAGPIVRFIEKHSGGAG